MKEEEKSDIPKRCNTCKHWYSITSSYGDCKNSKSKFFIDRVRYHIQNNENCDYWEMI